MRILQVSTSDFGGGAQQVAINLHSGFRRAGDDATLAVGYRHSTLAGVVPVDNLSARGVSGGWERVCSALLRQAPSILATRVGLLPLLLQPRRLAALVRGYEDFSMPATRSILSSQFGRSPEVVLCHNLHGSYFDLRELSSISCSVPTILLLHDMWLLTGHCAYALGCERWRSGCGMCPDLHRYPSIRRDATAANLLLKEHIYSRCRLRVAAPSRWLLEKARASVLGRSGGVLEWRHIPYGVDLNTFSPRDREESRRRLRIPATASVLLFAASAGPANPYKDYATIMQAARIVRARAPNTLFIVLGGATGASDEWTRFVPFVSDRSLLADYYRAADVFLHAAIEDNFPNTILECQACGTPVVATAVGGIPEQIEDGGTGVLVPPATPSAMAEATLGILQDPVRGKSLRARAADRARQLYSAERELSSYRSWFGDIVGETTRTRTARVDS